MFSNAHWPSITLRIEETADEIDANGPARCGHRLDRIVLSVAANRLERRDIGMRHNDGLGRKRRRLDAGLIAGM